MSIIPYTPNETFTATRKGNKIYVHVFDANKTELIIPALEGVKVLGVKWMNGSTADWTESNGQYQVKLPTQLPDKNSNVLVMQIDKLALDIPTQTTISK